MKEIYLYIKKRCIKLIKNDSKDISNITKDFYLKKSRSFELSGHQKYLNTKSLPTAIILHRDLLSSSSSLSGIT